LDISRIYSLRLERPEEWWETAAYLLDAASLLGGEVKKRRIRFDKHWKKCPQLRHTLRIQSVCFMIIAFSIENILKGVIVRQKRRTFRHPNTLNKTLPKILNNHNLLKLVELANIDISDEEKSLLLRLSRYSKWSGRYPIPVKAEDFTFDEPLSNGERAFVSPLSSSDVDRCNAFINKLIIKFRIKSIPTAA
jgi:hypothetical protein